MNVSEPLYLIPGLGSDGTIWAATIEALGSAVDAHIVDTLSDGTLGEMAARFLRNAPPKFALAGISMGGMVALEVMRQAPERVTRLALFDTNAAPDDAGALAQRIATRGQLSRMADFGQITPQLWSYLVHASAISRVETAMGLMMQAVGPARYCRQIDAVIARPDFRPVLSQIKVPTVVVIGNEDRVTPRHMTDAIVAGISGAQLIVIAGCGHLPPLEKPAETADILLSWLLTPPASPATPPAI